MARHLTTASNEFEADIILSRLDEAGIHAWESNSLGGPAGSAGPRDVYVDDDVDLERAKDVLREAQNVAEEELDEFAEGEPEER